MTDPIAQAREAYDRAVARLEVTRSIEIDFDDEYEAVNKAWANVISSVRRATLEEVRHAVWGDGHLGSCAVEGVDDPENWSCDCGREKFDAFLTRLAGPEGA